MWIFHCLKLVCFFASSSNVPILSSKLSVNTTPSNEPGGASAHWLTLNCTASLIHTVGLSYGTIGHFLIIPITFYFSIDFGKWGLKMIGKKSCIFLYISLSLSLSLSLYVYVYVYVYVYMLIYLYIYIYVYIYAYVFIYIYIYVYICIYIYIYTYIYIYGHSNCIWSAWKIFVFEYLT